MSEPAITVGYWGIRGLGAPLRMMMMYSKVPFKCECHDIMDKQGGGFECPSWFAVRKPELKAKAPLVNLPYVIDGDKVISQTNACFSYLGRKLGLWGDDDEQASMCEQLLCEIMDLRNKMTGFAYSPCSDSETVKANALKLLADVTDPSPMGRGILQKLDLCLAANKASGGCFFVSSHATAPDFHAWEMLDQFSMLAKYMGWNDGAHLLDAFPHLAAFHKKFAELPQNNAYLTSPFHSKMPFNNSMAVFGATPSFTPYVPGQECNWRNLSGVY
ncbi:hypothetical protein CEUSTIGMA_g12908.t1 [Chlamydomonas eustigma]|uniref:glutathione transferase n=1 Tax=Chlamydomonas eustigma TaxID=1157962 RepID=A0A250XRC3_9CHLO|nr:hypothetical protein CEUSTIGMA_g12908.t1 [Chlamydomonas eustigma]|eukprot:GAX85492.1 hypothetical protein CEUSTIGMA_g12908.t1 [Chlamydomonas eustigma]